MCEFPPTSLEEVVGSTSRCNGFVRFCLFASFVFHSVPNQSAIQFLFRHLTLGLQLTSLHSFVHSLDIRIIHKCRSTFVKQKNAQQREDFSSSTLAYFGTFRHPFSAWGDLAYTHRTVRNRSSGKTTTVPISQEPLGTVPAQEPSGTVPCYNRQMAWNRS